MDGFIRTAAASPRVRVADPAMNCLEAEKLINEAAGKKCSVLVFPELSVTGSTCMDLFFDSALIREAERELCGLMKRTAELPVLCVMGVPVYVHGALYNCAAVFLKGKLLGLCVKEYAEDSERRWFSKAPETPLEISFCGQNVILGGGLLFSCADMPGAVFGVETGDELYGFGAESAKLCENGALIILKPACGAELVGKAQLRRELMKTKSRELAAGIVCAGAGFGESTTDAVYAGHRLIAENGKLIAEGELFTQGITVSEIDVQRLLADRRRGKPFEKNENVKTVNFELPGMDVSACELIRRIPKSPFIPECEAERNSRFENILKMQSAALASRLDAIGAKEAVLAFSGGLDSTLALLVTVRAFDLLGLERKNITAISMPCFGTTGRTRNNALRISAELSVGFKEISIEKAVRCHFEDIGQSETDLDVTFENAQARERTQVLMDIANKTGALMVGTGDLSELALGWTTYNGDHMSMYGVNGDIPKTLVRKLVEYEAERIGGALKEALFDVIDTPVSPELLPPSNGEISQRTEDLVGPYELHDFFLYYMLRYGFAPGKIYGMACRAFEGEYDGGTVKKWIKVFYRRFFTQQFKRSCMPDGPMVGAVALSPRGAYKMPSDASSALWLREIEKL